jgi:site-specific DNA-methyltransferase (adenine-specific)
MADDAVDVCIADPPYSARQHMGVRSGKRNRGLADGQGRTDGCATRRVVDLGFSHFGRGEVRGMVRHLARVVRRWSLVFCDDDLLPVWRSEAKRAGLEVVRTGVWIRVGGAPQFTGDRPGTGAEYIAILHRPGRKRWNGGVSAGVWAHAEDCPIPGPLGPVLKHPIVANRKGQQGSRIHTTQKPEALMLDLVSLFSDPGELVLDCTAGSGTTGVAALRLGRRFVGIEMQPRAGHPGDADYFGLCCDRLRAEEQGSMLTSFRAGQRTLFGT